MPHNARWLHLQISANQYDIGLLIDEAIRAIGKDNPPLKGVLPKDYAHPALSTG